jgi:glyoxylase-like metal-dependent hydrolase (beta-lactamase superfamily II)
LIQQISDLDIKPTQIIATHGHFDHIMAAFELQNTFNIPFKLSSNDKFLLKRMNSNSMRFTGAESGPPPQIDKYLDREDSLTQSNNKFKLIPSPGHTPGSISIYLPDLKVVFVGDVLFAGGGIGRYDFDYCNYSDLTKSIQKLLSLPIDTTVYSGHGDTTTIGKEINYHRAQT